ncbi:MAG: anhydro-N-acetylmuramic acid kinase [Candidatus Marinimicrobia bacterium]|nr:anhydro-N-acetylmuramic acid kinase [Candidatus Neomarinimicrobiota bacterium]
MKKFLYTKLHQLSTKNPLRVVGLMSGTSMDGLDICLADVDYSPQDPLDKHSFQTRVLGSQTVSFHPAIKESIRTCLSGPTEIVCETHYQLGRYYAEQTARFLSELGIDKIDAVGMHGQTIHHISGEATLQIGEPSFLAEALGVPVISDFRARDISVGGTGAPLIPFVDQCLFQQEEDSIIAINLGGVANITFLPPRHSDSPVIGFDTGPGMALIDEARHLFGFDGFESSPMGLKGKPDEESISNWLKDPFITKKPPKSTGRDYFGESWIRKKIPNYSQWDMEDLFATLSLFTTRSIVVNCRQYTDFKTVSQIIISGGGVHNQAVMKMLQKEFSSIRVISSNEVGVDPDIKEALGFAILAAAYLKGIPANIPFVTGAKKAVILGKLTI